MKTIMDVLRFAQSQREVSSDVERIIVKCNSFKIGKTGETLYDRLNKPDYNDTYTHITSVYSGAKENVDDMESYLISKFINNPKCKNRKDGYASNNDTMAENSEKFQVYVVWK